MKGDQQKGVHLKVEQLTKTYDGVVVLRSVTFEVMPGELFVIMGPSGAGKSVLLRHIIGLEKPDAGQVFINGRSIFEEGTLKRFKIAMVFQSGALLNSLTVEENVALYLLEHRLYPLEKIQQIVREKLKLLGLEDAAKKLPSQLSGGMRKRVAIARALVMHPDLILYDEPTSELDPINAVNIGKEIMRLNEQEGVSSIVVTHDLDFGFGIADRIGILIDGELVAIGRPNEIKSSSDKRVIEFVMASLQIEKEKEA